MKENTAGGILLIIIGIIITAIWITVYGFQLYDNWYTTNIVYGKHFCTFGEHFWAVGKLQMTLALIAGGIPIVAGICQFFRKSE